MTACDQRRGLVGAALALLAIMPPVGALLERRMLTQMLLQLPALLAGGALMMPAAWHPPWSRCWNLAGVAGLLASSLAIAFWMMPIAIDRAAADVGWDAARAGSLAAGGALAISSWRAAPPVVQAFFVGNTVWMGLAIGLIYQDEGPRLCNAYLLDDQSSTGAAMTLLACCIGVLWLVRVTRALKGERADGCVGLLARPAGRPGHVPSAATDSNNRRVGRGLE